MFFSYFSAVDVDALASSLASEFMQRVPPDTLDKDVRGQKRRVDDAIVLLLGRVENYAQNNRLNMFKRARLGNTLRWKMVESGYPKTMVEPIVLDVVKRLTLVPQKSAKS